mmetsp:Transcript_89625/g.254057  ORF Transcript_89625/g.254057 Transcript_89625/m.254057 type:complete len:230 (+) Transcript_89625:322-1011(+)
MMRCRFLWYCLSRWRSKKDDLQLSIWFWKFSSLVRIRVMCCSLKFVHAPCISSRLPRSLALLVSLSATALSWFCTNASISELAPSMRDVKNIFSRSSRRRKNSEPFSDMDFTSSLILASNSETASSMLSWSEISFAMRWFSRPPSCSSSCAIMCSVSTFWPAPSSLSSCARTFFFRLRKSLTIWNASSSLSFSAAVTAFSNAAVFFRRISFFSSIQPRRFLTSSVSLSL